MLNHFFKCSIAIIFCLSVYVHVNGQTKYFLNNVSITCISKTETKTNDLIYVKLFSKNDGIKSTATKAFKDGEIKIFSEINLDDLSKKNGWAVVENDVLKIVEKDDSDEDDTILELKFSNDILKVNKHCFTKTFTIGKYKICFEIKTIKF